MYIWVLDCMMKPPSPHVQGHAEETQDSKARSPFGGRRDILSIKILIIMETFGVPRAAQLVKSPTSAQVMISRFMGWNPASNSVLTARSPEPASDSVSPSLAVSGEHSRSVSLCLSKMNKKH